MDDNAKLFRKRLKLLYRKIDSSSSLIWDHDNQLTRGKRTRSEIGSDEKELFWKNKETTQTGYGEISQGSTSALLNLFQSMSTIIEYKCKTDTKFNESLLYTAEEYNMTTNSLFLDIGSGFGKPVYHSALQVGCESLGIECVPARVEFCIDFFYELAEMKNNFIELDTEDIESKHLNNEYSETSNLVLNNNINLNDSNFKYYDDTIKDKSNLYLELRINPDLIYDNSFINLLCNKNKAVSILVDDYFNEDCLYKNNLLKFDECFTISKMNISITPIDDLLYSNLVKIITSCIFSHSDNIIRDIPVLYFLKNEKLRKFHEIVKKIENMKILDIILFVNTIFISNDNFKFSNSINYNLQSVYDRRENANKHTKDYYLQLEKELDTKLKNFNKENFNPNANENNSNTQLDQMLLKETLLTLKFKYPFDQEWYTKASFELKDATSVKSYVNKDKVHFTHIYSYNKLMSRECRSKMAMILNHSNFRVLAWYSNQKQTKKAGLKNFTFICKFPMQSTSTEKFHVYVFIKTK